MAWALFERKACCCHLVLCWQNRRVLGFLKCVICSNEFELSAIKPAPVSPKPACCSSDRCPRLLEMLKFSWTCSYWRRDLSKEQLSSTPSHPRVDFIITKWVSQQELLDNKMGPWLSHPMLSELNICLEQDLIFLKISSLTAWPFLLPRKIKVSMPSPSTALDHLGCCAMVYEQGGGWEQSLGCPGRAGLQWNC